MVSAAYTGFPINALRALPELRQQLEGALYGPDPLGDGPSPLPADLVETADELRFMIEVPGMKPQDIEVVVEDGVLTVTGSKHASATDGAKVRIAERRFGDFARRFRLPRSVDASLIRASCDAGLLTIRIPRAEAARARRIEVQDTAPAEAAPREVGSK